MVIAVTTWIILSSVIGAIEVLRKVVELLEASRDKKDYLEEVKYQSDNINNALKLVDPKWDMKMNDDRFVHLQRERKQLVEELEELENMSSLKYVVTAKTCHESLKERY